ncbi:tetratricopeptide repeat protein [Dongia rigui]|uniref:Tetratricopeptide repeat protein n=1 Tax=Dongia rigui TaxID=940149 RepID=A0ABU5E4S2_9PROT|nr:tetratricopeptide repeat protein [Dongia rigui]MDY0874205.1 tetratricopeptide repeat protein [Dongia rigui]
MSRILIVVAFILAIALGGVAGYLSVDKAPPQVPAPAVVAQPEMPTMAAQASDDGDYGPDWPICRDMSNDPTLRFRACDNVLAKGGLTQRHQSWALNNRGTANLGMNNVEAAIKDFSTASKIDPGSASPYINLANIARKYGRLAEALELTDKAIALSPSDDVYCVRAATLRDLGRVEEGLAATDAAEKLGPLSDCTKFIRAHLLELHGQNEMALLAQADIGENDKAASAAACQRARLKAQEGKLREAFDLYAQGMRLDADNRCAVANAALYAPYAMPFDEALVFIKEAMHTHPSLLELNCNLGQVYEMQDENRLALAAYNAAIEGVPTAKCGFAQRARYWAQQGDLTAALKDYDIASRLPPERSDIWKGRAKVMAKLGRSQDALASYDRALAQAPEDAEALQERGDLRMALQFYPQASEDFAALVSLKPGAGYGHYRLALARFATKSSKGAVQACAQLPAGDAWEDACRLLSAEAQLMGGDPAGAIAALEQMALQSPIRRHADLLAVGILLMNGEVERAAAAIDRYRATYPDQLYGAVWAALVARAANKPIPADVTSLSDRNDIWPMPVLRRLVQGGQPADLLAAAETPDPRLSRQRLGEAEFYLGVGAMLDGDANAAARYFKKAVETGYAEQAKEAYPAAYSFSNGQEFAMAAWAASDEH